MLWGIFCCDCRRFWRRRVASLTLRVRRGRGHVGGGSQDEDGMPGQGDTVSLQPRQDAEAADRELWQGPPPGDRVAKGGMSSRRPSSSAPGGRMLKQKRKLTSLPSLPLQKYVNKSSSNGHEAIRGQCADIGPGDLLPPPAINLIPPTPFNLINDDLFFQINLEEGSIETGSSECPRVGDARNHGPDTEGGALGISVGNNEAGTPSPFGPNAKPGADPLEDSPYLNSEHALLQQELKSNWAREQKMGLEVTSSQTYLLSHCEEIPLPQDPKKSNQISKGENSREQIKATLWLNPLQIKLRPKLQLKRPASRRYSLDNVKSMSGAFWSPGLAPGTEGAGSPRQRRITLESYIPPSTDPNGSLKGKENSKEPKERSLEEMNTDEVCEWVRKLGLEKCIPIIKEKKLQGQQLASIDPNILDQLQLATTEEKEILLSSIYKEVHPVNTACQSLDNLLETIGPHDIERFTAALLTLGNSQSSGWAQSNHTHNREEKAVQDKKLKKSHLVNLSVKAFQQNLQLKVPRNSTVAKVIDACQKILGLKEGASHLSLNIITSKTGQVAVELPAEKQIGELKVLEKKELKLQLCRKASRNLHGVENNLSSSSRHRQVPESGLASVSPHGTPTMRAQKYQMELRAKEDEISELKQLIKSLKVNHQRVLELLQCSHSLHREAVYLLTESVCPATPQEDSCCTEAQLTKKEMFIEQLTLAQKELGNESCIDKALLKQMKLDYQILKEKVFAFYQKQEQVKWENVGEWNTSLFLQQCDEKF
ncbi:uncharacterized protein LOC125454821 [Stegostoma tigrinum]|uniref:uncharacterized protein LOC125454821 n=1 Tax=Stegostoma tigrinum TaxID=3053191 RepID=UPI0028705687|nr:uncharacterized protein LOC125454821 [Stegostoma tigrinum]